jgi:succinate dehydrogenase / fumarate reductase iron-sulfur subunit
MGTPRAKDVEGAGAGHNEESREITFKIFRYAPEDGEKPYYSNFKIPVCKGMTVLEGLHYIKENIDSTLTYRYSCRMGICGSCGMFINGFPRLACNVQIFHLDSDVIEVKPMPNHDVIKDLVPDLAPFFEKHRGVMPYLLRKDLSEQENPSSEYFQSPDELLRYIQFAYCIKCGLCISACPTAATDPEYTGPQALSQAHRYNTDTRDEGSDERIAAVSGPHGPWACHFAGACSEVCPRGVDPAFAIQLLKGDIVARKLRLRRSKPGNKAMGPYTEAVRNPEIPEAPEPTVKK